MACPEHLSHLGHLKIMSCTACTCQTWSPVSCVADVEVAPLVCIELGKMFSQNNCQQHAVTPRLTNHCCFQKFMPSSLLLIIKLGVLWRKILYQPYGIQYILGSTSPPLRHGRIHTTLFLPFFSFWYTRVLTTSHPLASASWVLGLEMSAPPYLAPF